MNKKQFACSRTFIATYLLANLTFILLCSYRLSLLIRSRPGTVFTLLIFGCLSLAFVLLTGKLFRAEDKTKINVLSTISAVFFTYGFTILIPAEKSLMWLLIFSASAFFLKYSLPVQCDAKVRSVSLVLGTVFAVFTFLGWQLQEYGRLELLYVLDDPTILLRMLSCFSGLIMCYTVILNTVFSKILQKDFSACNEEKRLINSNFLLVCILTVGILLCWLPYYYAFYPGNLSPDSLYEIRQQLGMSALSNHHPYIHQKLLSICLMLGAESLESGIGIYTAFQMFSLALVFALCVFFLRKLGINRSVCCIAYCFFAVFTVNSFYSVTVWKDVFHGAISLGLMILLVLEAMGPRNGKERILLGTVIVAASFLFCTFRNNGWHAFLLGFPLYIICNRRSWKRLAALFMLTVILVSGYNHVIFDVLGIKKSASGEALSVPLQQIARTVNRNPEEIYSEDFTVLREVFPNIEELGDKYRSYISDPVKSGDTFLSEEFDKNPLRYLKSWAKVGLRHPVTYVEAFLLQNYGYWYPDVDYWIIHNTIEENELGLSHREERFALRHELSMLTKELSKDLPTSILYSLGLMVWLMIIAAALLCLKGRGRLASPLWIMAMLWLTTLASPVYCEYRYLYGFVVSVPLFLGMAFGVKPKTK